MVEVGVEVRARSSSTGCRPRSAPWTPLVTAEDRPWSMTSCQVALAVAAWSLLTALAPVVRRRLKAVMSNWPRSPSVPSPRSRTSLHGTPPASSSGPATRRTRSASKRSLPADTGVWIVNDGVALDPVEGVVEGEPVRDVARGPARPAGRPSAPRSGARRPARCRAPGAHARRRCRGRAPGGAASRGRGRTGCA